MLYIFSRGWLFSGGRGGGGGYSKNKKYKNLDWEILIKNLVTFKRWDKVKDEKIEYFQGGSRKTNI